MKLERDGGKHGLSGEMEVDFLQRAVAVERRVQNIECARVPPGADRKWLERVARLAHDTPDLPIEFRAFESVDGV
jgi:hypothetical protein